MPNSYSALKLISNTENSIMIEQTVIEFGYNKYIAM